MLAERLGRGTALRFVVLIGVVSLLADLTYEGARSITGPFLAALGAGAGVVGVVAGAGELVGYGLRVVSGRYADRTGRYWPATLGGYAVNLLAVPLLALAGRWEVAAVFIVAERLGKAVRTPPRDAMLAHATAEMGRGWGFGLHEAMDQAGAVLGPLLVAAVLALGGGYRGAFAVLLIPAAAALSVLVAARRRYPHPRSFEADVGDAAPSGAPGRSPAFRRYLLFVGAAVAGYAHFQLISFHLVRTSVVPLGTVPIYFAVAMGADAVAALVAGRAFDRVGLAALVAVPLLTVAVAPLAFSVHPPGALLGVVLWGAVMGIQETVMRAAIPSIVPRDRRGTAYGVFNLVYGASWFAGSAAMGFLYERSIGGLVAFVVGLEVLAAAMLALLLGRGGRGRAR